MADKKVKFGARISRAFIYGSLLGFIFFVIAYMFAYIMNDIGGTTVINALDMGIFGWLVGAGASFGMEISKDMEED